MGARARARAATSFRSRPAIRRRRLSRGTSSRRSPRELLGEPRRQRAAVRPDARLPAAARGHRRRSWSTAASPRRLEESARHDRLAAGARSRRARAARSRRRGAGRAADLHRRDHRVPQRAGARWSACRRRRTASISTRSTPPASGCAARAAASSSSTSCRTSRIRPGLLIGLDKRRAAARMGRAPRRAHRRGRSRIASCTSKTRRPRPTSGRSRPTIATDASST